MNRLQRSVLVAISIACLAGQARAAQYPLALTLDAKVTSGATTITSKVTIRVDRLMEETRRKRVTDALEHGGYGNFLPALRMLPAVGSISTEKRMVDIKYVREEESGSRLILVADRPIFFIAGDQAKPKAGYELTVVELRIDGQGNVTGRIAGAARVKPSPAGVVLDDFTEAPVELTGRAGQR